MLCQCGVENMGRSHSCCFNRYARALQAVHGGLALAGNPALAIFVRLRASGWDDVCTDAYPGQ